MGQQFGDTTLTKVFVGGLAWETQKDTLREHFEKYGDILEAVIISDKLSGRSKGYGFVTFKEPEAAKKACEDGTPVINGRRANCNLASLGAKRTGGLRPSPPATPAPPAIPAPHQHVAGMTIGSRGVTTGPPAPWYYHPSGAVAQPQISSPFQHQPHQYPGIYPFYTTTPTYGYSPNYMTDLSYNSKLSHNGGGGYYQGQYSYPAQGVVAANAMVPMYPLYQLQHHQSQGMGLPAHFFPPTTGAMTAMPAIISKPPAVINPTSTVEQVTGCS